MAENCVIMGTKGRLVMNGVRYQFDQIEQKTVRLIANNNPASITGDFDSHKDNQVNSIEIVGFVVTMQPSIAEWATLIPLIFANGSGPYTTGSTSKEFTSGIDYNDVIHKYTNCKINKAQIAGQKGASLLRLSLEIFAVNEVKDNAFTIPSNVFGAGYAFTEGVLTLRGATRYFDQFMLSVDKMLYRDFNNSVNATCIESSGNEVKFITSNNYVSGTPDNTELYFAEKDGDGQAGILKFARSTNSMQFDFPYLKGISRPPSIVGKHKPIKMQNVYEVMRDNTTPAVKVTLT